MISEGERGLLGVGYAPARVVATLLRRLLLPLRVRSLSRRVATWQGDVRELLERITAELGVRCRVDVAEDDEAVTASLAGDDLGLLIGRHGQTIDAIQYLANAIAWRAYGDERKDVVVDAAGYRERRRVTLESLAMTSAERARSTGEPVELEPMTSIERRIVHLRLKELPGRQHAQRGRGAVPLRRRRAGLIHGSSAGSSGCSRLRA